VKTVDWWIKMAVKWFNPRKFLPWLMLILLSIASYGFLRHNAAMYTDQLASVIAIRSDKTSEQVDQFNNQVVSHSQLLDVKLLNGQNKGRTIQITNSADTSQGVTQILKTGDQIFLSKGQDSVWQFQTMKRDAIWVPILIFVIGALVLLMGKRGRLTAASLGINVLLFILTIYLDLATNNGNIFLLFALFSVVASTLTLGLVLGFKNKLMWMVLLTVISTTIVTLLLTVVVFAITNQKGLHFELMAYLTTLPEPLFFSMTLIGVLGAVMDEATDMIATLMSLELENPNITSREIVRAGRHVGQEIFGALTNVLFLIFIAEQVPMAVLYLRNGNNWGYTYDMNLSLGMVQTLVSAIGIVMTVPIGIAWVLLLRQRKAVS
jgi:uncharacterized membrane protein